MRKRIVTLTWIVITTAFLTSVGGWNWAGAASSANGVYDTDGDGLIEISNLEQLNAIRYDYVSFDPNSLGDPLVIGWGNPAVQIEYGASRKTEIKLLKGAEAEAHRAAYHAAFPLPEGESVCESGACGGYELTRSLDFNDAGSYASGSVNADWTTGEGWDPIYPYFHGVFDGNGHTISNLYINRPDPDKFSRGNRLGVGLFTRFYSAAVHNIRLADVEVHGGAGPIGGLAGVLEGPLNLPLLAAYGISYGMVYDHPNRIESVIQDSHVTGTVSGAGDSRGGVGGLVGTAFGVSTLDGNVVGYSVNIIDSSFSGMVWAKGEERKAGGIVGYYRVDAPEYSLDRIVGSVAEGTVSVEGKWGYAGGLVGETIADINDGHARVDVDALGMVSSAGGLAGASSMRIHGSSASGHISADGVAGGLVGTNGGIISNSHASGDVTGTGAGGLVASSGGIIRSSHATGVVSAVQAQDSFDIPYAGGLVGALFPRVTEPILDITFIQVLDSSATGDVYRTAADGAPGKGAIGGLVGGSTGGVNCTISTSYATGDITSFHGAAGGLVGDNRCTVARSYATGNVIGQYKVGGLTGYNSHAIHSSYSVGNVTGEEGVGGLVGQNNGSIRFSYAIGNVSSDHWEVGGLVGLDVGSSTRFTIGDGGERVGEKTTETFIEAAYWNTETTGQSAGLGYGTRQGAEGKSTIELQAPTSYTGIYASWWTDADNADEDDNPTTGIDDFWDFRDSNQYPALKADRNGDGLPTWQEFGNQLIQTAASITPSSQGAGQSGTDPAVTSQPIEETGAVSAALPAAEAATSPSEGTEEQGSTAVSAAMTRAVPAISQGAGQSGTDPAVTSQPIEETGAVSAALPAAEAATFPSEGTEEQGSTAVSAAMTTAMPAAADPVAGVDESAISLPESAPASQSGGGCGLSSGGASVRSTASSIFFLLAPLAMIAGMKVNVKRRRDEEYCFFAPKSRM